MRAKLLVAGVLTGLLTTGGAAMAKAPPAGGARPLPPAEATTLAATGVSSGSVTRSVSADEALAAATRPGATVSVAPGLSLREAVGLGSAGATPSATVAAEAAIGCAANAAWWQWGTWPYEQRITDTTYWCAVYGDHITYRSSSVDGNGTLCSTNWTGSALVSGGIGYSWFVMRSSAGFACPTVIPWITLHPSHYLDVSRNAWGNSAIVATG
jgi:hypothetical protein